MRTYVATLYIDTPYSMDKFFDVNSTRNIKYKFASENDKTLCYLTIIASNRLQLRKLKHDSIKVLKKYGKVELIVGVG